MPTPRPWLPSSGFVTTGIPDALRGRDRLVGRAHDLAPRHRKTRRREQLVREFLVLRDVDRERRRHRGHRRAYPLLVLALTELHERLLVQSDERDVTARRLVEDRLRRGTERAPLGEPDQSVELAQEVETRIGRDEVIDQTDGDAPGCEPDLLLPIPVDDVVAPRSARASGLPPVDLRARLALQLDRDVLRDVAGPRALDQPFAEPSGVSSRARMLSDAGKRVEQGLCEALDRVGRPELERAEVDEQLDRRLVGVVVGPAEDALVDDREVGTESRSL